MTSKRRYYIIDKMTMSVMNTSEQRRCFVDKTMLKIRRRNNLIKWLINKRRFCNV